MSDSSERELQAALHGHQYYTQKAPSSGYGIVDPATGDHIDQADIVAIRSVDIDSMTGTVGSVPRVLLLEDKHVKPDSCVIEGHEVEQLERIEAITGGTAYFAVKWKYTQDDHRFFRPAELQDTGKHWKITRDQGGATIDEL